MLKDIKKEMAAYRRNVGSNSFDEIRYAVITSARIYSTRPTFLGSDPNRNHLPTRNPPMNPTTP